MEVQEYYFDLLLNKTSEIIDNKSISKREKFAQITRLANNVLFYFQTESLDNTNFKDLDLSKFSVDMFSRPSFPVHATDTSYQQAI